MGYPKFSNEDIDKMSKGAYQFTRDTIAKRYNEQSFMMGLEIDKLPSDLQTVLVDVGFPFGQNYDITTKSDVIVKFWNDIISRDYEAAAQALDDYTSKDCVDGRMQRNAERLRKLMKNKELPTQCTSK